MAFRLHCYICDDPYRINQFVRLNHENEGQKTVIATRRRHDLQLPEQEVNADSRICLNCNRSVLNEIQAYQDDEDPTVLKVLFKSSARSCFICPNENPDERVSLNLRTNIFVNTEIYISPHVRVCSGHLDSRGILFKPLLNGLRGIRKPYNLKGNELTSFLKCLQKCFNQSPLEHEENFPEEEFSALTSLSKDLFRDLFQLCHPVPIYDRQRTISKKDLLCFLCKLRQCLSGHFLKAMFSYSSRQLVSLTILKVLLSLDINMSPLNIGFGHIHRDEFINHHVSDFSNVLFNENPDVRKAIIIIDATYIEIQKSRNFQVLRQSFSVHKHYHLLKPTILCAPNGYILAVVGPYFSDTRNNDANILLDEYNDDLAELRNWFVEGDIFVLDRGYRDAGNFLRDVGIQTEMPSFLGHRPQLPTDETNKSRLITKCRYIVESRNGHVKSMFKIFRDTFPNSLVPRLAQFLRVACAFINRYHPTIQPENDTPELAQQMLQRSRQPNALQHRIENEGIFRRHGVWEAINQHELPNFPILNLDYLRDLTFGTFLMKMAPSYVHDNIQEFGDVIFEKDIQLNIPNILRLRIKSRHRNAVKYQLAIEYNGENDPISGYYCTCRSGARTLGTCCHVASVIWFLGYARHQPNQHYPQETILNEVSDTGNRNNPLII